MAGRSSGTKRLGRPSHDSRDRHSIRRYRMSATRSALLRMAALGTVAILGIVILVPALGGSPRAAAQVITTGASGSSTASQGITVEGSGIVIATPDEATLSLGVQTQAATATG